MNHQTRRHICRNVAQRRHISRPEFAIEYQRLQEISAAEPEWHTGEIVYGVQIQAHVYG